MSILNKKLTKQSIDEYFKFILEELLKPGNIIPLHKLDGADLKHLGAGVYFIFDKQKLCYVGESGNLSGRFKEFKRTMNHSFRRSLATYKYSSHPDYVTPNSRTRFSGELEALLDRYCEDFISVSFMSMPLGRLEFEEWVTDSRNYVLLNKKKKRKA